MLLNPIRAGVSGEDSTEWPFAVCYSEMNCGKTPDELFSQKGETDERNYG